MMVDDIFYQDTDSMVKIIDEFSLSSDLLYLIGTQTYIRLVKIALKI